MQLIQEDNKLYILASNAEQVGECESWNGWDGTHSTRNIKGYNFYHAGMKHTMSPLMGIQEGKTLEFHGNKGIAYIKVDKVYEVNRVIPYDTTDRSYWGEFRRSHKLVPRLNKLVRCENNYIIEGTLLHGQGEVESLEFTQFGNPQWETGPMGWSRAHTKEKTWNLSMERSLGPNLKDYSLNDCYKYYATL